MISDNDNPNIAPETEARKGDWPVAGARVHPDDLRLIDVARAYIGQSRSEFLMHAAVDRARDVLGSKAPDILAHFPASERETIPAA